jgi:hypothetical protein
MGAQPSAAAPQPETPPPGPETRWQAPSPYNYPAAIDSMGTIAAPLLASVSLALIAVVLSSASSFRWVDAVLFLLVIASAAFIATVEFAFMARQYAVTPSDLELWWPDHEVPERRDRLRSIQRYHRGQFKLWADRARNAYNVALLALILGVTVLLIPKGNIGHANGFRVLAVVLLAAAFVAEFVWAVFAKPNDGALPPVGPENLLTADG